MQKDPSDEGSSTGVLTLDEESILRAIMKRVESLQTIVVPAESGTRQRGVVFVEGPEHPPSPLKVEYILSKQDTRLLDRFLNSSPQKFEVEVTFGVFGPLPSNPKKHGFRPGFRSIPAFHALKQELESRARKRKIGKETSLEMVETMDGVHVRRITQFPSGDVVWQKKYRSRENKRTGQKLMIENPRWGIRIYQSEEQFITEGQVQKELKEQGYDSFVPNVRRVKRRSSYFENSKESDLYGVRFDLSFVEETRFVGERKEKTYTKAEVEIERVKRKEEGVTAERMIKAIKKVLLWSQRASSFDYVIGLPEVKYAIAVHNNLFYFEDRRKSTDPFRLYSYYWNKPHNIKITDFLVSSFSWSVTVKLDGSRRFLLLDSHGTYLFGPPYDVIRVGPGVKKHTGTLIDGEFMMGKKKEYHCFDILFLDGQNVRRNMFSKRQELLKEVFSYIQKISNLEIVVKRKEFFQEGNLYQRIKKTFKAAKKIPPKKQDGLILQPHGEYWNKHTLKWKPPEKLTIDFLVEATADPTQARLLVGGAHGKKIPFRGTPRYPLPEFQTLADNEINDDPLAGRIVEMAWRDGQFMPVRFRDDRDRPNNLATARDVWEDIMKPISKDTLYGDTLVALRRYFNDLKRNLLQIHLSGTDNILDIGSGRGGDLSKWNQALIKNVYAVEPNEKNLEELERRKGQFKGLKTNVHTLNLGAEETDKIQKALGKKTLDGIVAFFSLTFFTKNTDLYSGLLKTIDLLPPGGRFIGIVMDGERTRELLEKAKEREIQELLEKQEREEKKAGDQARKKFKKKLEEVEKLSAWYGTRAFTIEQKSLFTEKLTGNKIMINVDDPDSMVKDQEEWLFYFRPFRESLRKMGFVFHDKPFRTKDYSSNFIDGGDVFGVLPEDSQTFSSLFRMFTFVKGRRFKSFRNVLPKPGKWKRLPNPYDESLSIVGVEKDPSSILHAALMAYSTKAYKDGNTKAQTEKLRKDLAEYLTLEIFQKLPVADLFQKYQEEALVEFKKYLEDPKSWLSKERVVDLLEQFLDVNIFILWGRVENDKVVSISTVPFRCPDFQGRKEAIVLYTSDNKFFYPVRRSGRFLFSLTDPFIQKLFKEACPKTT